MMNDRNIDGISHDQSGGVGNKTAGYEERQIPLALNEPRALAVELMEQVCEYQNLNRAYKRVKSNKGAAGIDGMPVEQLRPYWEEHGKAIIESLLTGSYTPKPVKEIEIPKPGGGIRQLGIPTVIDRLIQQAILQVLEPLLDPTFSESSYGFRPGRSAHQALKRAGEYVAEGKAVVVDIDLEKFFDRINHDILMSRLARRIGDRRLLKIVRSYLKAGIMRQGVCIARHMGSPQGGPLSPLLSNLLLDELDKELEKRGHSFCRYADDCNIYVKSQKAGERVMISIRHFLQTRLKLKLNEDKSAVDDVSSRKFLGYRIWRDGRLGIAPQSLKRAKDKIRKLTRRNRGKSLDVIIKELNPFLTGWMNYFGLSTSRRAIEDLDGWIRRKLRCYRLKQRKRSHSIRAWLVTLGINANEASKLAGSPKGWWRLSKTPTINIAMSNAWFKEQGLVNLLQKYMLLNT